MKETSIKKFSTAEVESAIAKALADLTGWEKCTVNIGTIEFVNPSQTIFSESAKLQISIDFSSGEDFSFNL